MTNIGPVCTYSSTTSWFSGGETRGLVQLNGAWWEFRAEPSAPKAITLKAFPANGSDWQLALSFPDSQLLFQPSWGASGVTPGPGARLTPVDLRQLPLLGGGKKLKRNTRAFRSKVLLSHAEAALSAARSALRQFVAFVPFSAELWI